MSVSLLDIEIVRQRVAEEESDLAQKRCILDHLRGLNGRPQAAVEAAQDVVASLEAAVQQHRAILQRMEAGEAS